MLGQFFQNKIEDASATARLREMVAVLRKREVVRGMTPEKLRMILEDLGPTFVKLGQVMSMRPDFLPPDYCDELMKLQSSAKPLPFAIILEVIEQEYNRRWNQVFSFIDEEALGSASIAQVHRAVLTSGEKVVVKVQRPGIYQIMSKDIVLLKRAATLIKVLSSSQDVIDFNMVLDEMWTIAKQEMDFLMEADHIEEFQHLNSEIDYVASPRVFRQLSTQHILVMEFVDGVRIDDFDSLRAKGYDIDMMGRHLGENYVKQIIEDGFFHADSHPGNIWIRNGRIVWLDLGMMGRLSGRDRMAIRKAVYALATHDTFEMKAAVLSLGVVRGRINHTALYQDIDAMLAQYSSLDFSELQMGVLTRQIMNLMRVHKIACPQGLSMFARGVLTVESVMRLCCPKISFVEIFAKSLALDYKKNFDWKEEWGKAKREGMLLLRKSAQLPEQISDILKMTMSGQTKVNLDLTGSEEPLRKLDQMINKIILAVLVAALLLGSSTICTTQMTPKIMEIPLLGFLGYLVAFVLSLRIIWEIHKGA